MFCLYNSLQESRRNFYSSVLLLSNFCSNGFVECRCHTWPYRLKRFDGFISGWNLDTMKSRCLLHYYIVYSANPYFQTVIHDNTIYESQTKTLSRGVLWQFLKISILLYALATNFYFILIGCRIISLIVVILNLPNQFYSERSSFSQVVNFDSLSILKRLQ